MEGHFWLVTKICYTLLNINKLLLLYKSIIINVYLGSPASRHSSIQDVHRIQYAT